MILHITDNYNAPAKDLYTFGCQQVLAIERVSYDSPIKIKDDKLLGWHNKVPERQLFDNELSCAYQKRYGFAINLKKRDLPRYLFLRTFFNPYPMI